MKFTGVVVRSETKQFADNEAWNIWIYNRGTDHFVKQSATLVDEDSENYNKSTLSFVRRAFGKAGTPTKATEDVVGFEYEFEVQVRDLEIRGAPVTSVRYVPVRKIGAASTEELATLDAKLTAQFASKTQATATSTFSATPVSINPDMVDALLTLFDGKTEDEAKAAAYKSKALDTDTVNAVVLGSAATALIGKSLLTLDTETGRYERA